MSDVDDQMMAALNALQRDEVRHDVNSLDDGGEHRLVVNGDPGPWVSAYAIARNGIYCATTPRFADYFGNAMPRVFFAIAIQQHKELRQPSPRTPRSAGPTAVSNPGPGDEEGIETAPPSSRAPDGGAVPRLRNSAAPMPASMCKGCMGHGVVGHQSPTDERRPCRACGGTGTIK